MGKHEDGEGRSKSRRREHQPAGIRNHRIEELFREEIRSLLDGELADPRLDGVQVTRVELSPDGARARVWYMTMFDEFDSQQIDRAFTRASGYIRSRLCEALSLKRTPELAFRLDPTALGEAPGAGED